VHVGFGVRGILFFLCFIGVLLAPGWALHSNACPDLHSLRPFLRAKKVLLAEKISHFGAIFGYFWVKLGKFEQNRKNG